MAELEDFEYQLNAAKGYVGTTSSEAQSNASTYVDPNDGTVYEWDEKQKGWVPKVMFLIKAHLVYLLFMLFCR